MTTTMNRLPVSTWNPLGVKLCAGIGGTAHCAR